MTDSPFQTWSSSIDKAQVTSILLEYKELGYIIYEGKIPAVNGFTILDGDASRWVAVRPHDLPGTWSVCISPLGRTSGPVDSITELRARITRAMIDVGMKPHSPPAVVYTELTEPVSSMVRIRQIIGASSIVAIFDPYITNETFARIIDLTSIGVGVDSDIKLLSSSQNLQKSGKKRLSESFFEDFKSECAVSAELRMTSKKKHLRFILLSDGRCIMLDFSLNKMQDGSLHAVSDPKVAAQLKADFDKDWEDGTVLYI